MNTIPVVIVAYITNAIKMFYLLQISALGHQEYQELLVRA